MDQTCAHRGSEAQRRRHPAVRVAARATMDHVHDQLCTHAARAHAALRRCAALLLHAHASPDQSARSLSPLPPPAPPRAQVASVEARLKAAEAEEPMKDAAVAASRSPLKLLASSIASAMGVSQADAERALVGSGGSLEQAIGDLAKLSK